MDNTAQVTVTETENSVLYSAGNQPPAVLIVHTHGTECYSQNGSTYSDAEIGFRSKDTEENMIAVGKKQHRPYPSSEFQFALHNHA